MKEKSVIRIAWGWFGRHVMGVILCFLVSFALTALTNSTLLLVLIGILSLLLYGSIIGSPAWQQGNRDLNKVKFKRREQDLLRGFKIGMVASVPMFVLAIGLLLAKAELLPNFYIIYKLVNGEMLAFIGLIDGAFRGVQSAYLTMVSWPQVIGVCLLNFIPPVIWEVYYLLGYKDIVIAEKVIYKNQKKTPKA